MKKKYVFLSLLIIAFLIILSNMNLSNATTITSGNYQYEVKEDGTINILKYTDEKAEQVNVPDTIDGKTVTSLGYRMFINTYTSSPAVKKVTIPKTITLIDYMAFTNAPHIQEIIVDSVNTKYTSVNGVLYSKDKTRLIYYPVEKTDTSYDIPSTTKVIGTLSFSDNKYLQSVTIPSSITKIEGYAFSDAKKITSITIPSSVIKIETGICYRMPELTTVVYNTKYDYLPSITFDGCTKLQTIDLSQSEIKGIGQEAFGRCKLLKNFTLPPKLEYIEKKAFKDCTNLTSITLPNTVTKIGVDAFDSTCNVDFSKVSLTKLLDGSYSKIAKISVDATLDYEQAYKVLDLVNAERAKVGATPLKMDKRLLAAAMQRTTEISVFFEHTRPNGMADKSILTDINYTMQGENIAIFQRDAESVMNTWMNSPGHKSNILNNEFTNIGIGSIKIGNSHFWVQIFTKSTEVATLTKPDNVPKNMDIEICTDFLNLCYSKEQQEIKIGETFTNKIYQKYEDASLSWSHVVPLNLKDFSWKSSNSKIATVDENGNVKGISGGTATITATTKEGEVSISYKVTVTLPFNDVNGDVWYYSAVEYCYNKGIILGTSKTTFNPNTKLTRAQLVTILHRMEGQPYVSGKSKFKDVQDTNAYYYVAVKWASSKNIVSGYNNGDFGPNDYITREQLAVILNNYCRYKGKYKAQVNVLTNFKDSNKISDFAYWGMRWATGVGVITGGNGMLNPQGETTRAEASSMIYKYCLNIK